MNDEFIAGKDLVIYEGYPSNPLDNRIIVATSNTRSKEKELIKLINSYHKKFNTFEQVSKEIHESECVFKVKIHKIVKDYKSYDITRSVYRQKLICTLKKQGKLIIGGTGKHI